MIVLGIETSCDETAVGLVRHKGENQGEILANLVASQEKDHAQFGGVVPEIAARAHINILTPLIEKCLKEAGLNGFDKIDAIGATAGPGLIGGVMVGLVMAKAIAMVKNIPFLAINHLEAHALSARLSHRVDYPFLLLLISGGHSALLSVEGLGKYQTWGRTRDDAVGEAFDKTARLLGLGTGLAGGAEIEKAAQNGDENSFTLPKPFFGAPHCDFSFAGLKTAVRRLVESEAFTKDEKNISNLAASFQKTIADCLTERTEKALEQHKKRNASAKPLTIIAAGGVAANQLIRQQLTHLAEKHQAQFIAPPHHLCTDNGAMIAWAAAEHFFLGETSPLSAKPRARWDLA